MLSAGNLIGSFSPNEPLTIDAGRDLSFEIGGSEGSVYGTVGPHSISGVLAGKVGRFINIAPGTITQPLPFIGNPAGYVFLNGKEIWPNLNFFRGMNGQLSLDPRIRSVFNPGYRTVSIDRLTPTGTYFYHPLTPSDITAFDGIALDAGAYDFIDGKLGLKGDNTFSPFYQEDGKQKNKKGNS